MVDSLSLIIFGFLLALIASIVLGWMRRKRQTKSKDISIAAEVESEAALAEAEASLSKLSDQKWVTIASASSHQGFREADLQGAVAYLGRHGIAATYRSSASGEGIQDYRLEVMPENVALAKRLLEDFLKKG